MEAMTENTVRDSWNRSVFAVWWWFMLERPLFQRVALFTAKPNSDEWKTCWLMYELYARRLTSAWNAPEASVSGRTRKKAESKAEHDRRLEGYAEMERKRRERYDASLMYDSDDDDECVDEKDEKQQVEAELLVEQLDECEDREAEEDKENRPPDSGVSSSFLWESECLMVQRIAEEAELRWQQRRGG